MDIDVMRKFLKAVVDARWTVERHFTLNDEAAGAIFRLFQDGPMSAVGGWDMAVRRSTIAADRLTEALESIEADAPGRTYVERGRAEAVRVAAEMIVRDVFGLLPPGACGKISIVTDDPCVLVRGHDGLCSAHPVSEERGAA